ILERRHLPAIVALLALGALALVAARTRQVMLYALRLCFWTEARLDEGGRVELESGELIGIVATPTHGRPLEAGEVLVSPESVGGKGPYRDVSILPRRHIAFGSHTRWQRATLRALHSARSLAVVCIACAGAALAARLLGH